MSALNEIVGGYGAGMNILCIDLTRFCTALSGRHVMKKSFDGLLWLIGHCGNHEDVLNTGMILHSDFDHRKYYGSDGYKSR